MIIYFKNVFCLCLCPFNMPSARGEQKRVSDPPGLELQMIVSHRVGAVNWAQVLWRTVTPPASWLFLTFEIDLRNRFPTLAWMCAVAHAGRPCISNPLFSTFQILSVCSLCYGPAQVLINEVFTLACPHDLVSALESFGPHSCVTVAALEPNYSMTSPMPRNQCCFHIPNRCKVGRDLRQSSQADFNFRNCFFMFSPSH